MRRSAFSLILGLVLAVTAVGLMMMYLRAPRQVQQTQQGMAMGTLVIATADMSFGAPLQQEHLKLVSWPKDAIPADTFSTIDEIFAGATVDDKRVALRLITKGEPVLKSKVSGFGEKATLSRRVASDKRAVSIRINDVSGVAGFLLPGDRVDVMLTREIGNSRDNQVTDIILQNLTVLGIDQLTDEQRDKPTLARTATVEATPEESQKLALAQELGSLSLALRNNDSNDTVKTSRIEASDLSPTPAPKYKPHPVVRVRYGSDKVVTTTVRP